MIERLDEPSWPGYTLGMPKTTLPVKITINRSGDRVDFQLTVEDLIDHLKANPYDSEKDEITVFHETGDRDFLLKVRALIDDAIKHPRETDTRWIRFRRALGIL